jgi:hypothetical protein
MMTFRDKLLGLKYKTLNKLYALAGKKRGTVLERLRSGKIPPILWNEAMDDALEEWHVTDTSLACYEFMGLTWEEYARWAEKPSAIYGIVYGYGRGCNVC